MVQAAYGPLIEAFPVLDATRRFSQHPSHPGGAMVVPQNPGTDHHLISLLQRSQKRFSLLAHTRGVLGSGCVRTSRGAPTIFVDEVVFTAVNPHTMTPFLPRCTNCTFKESTEICGSVPLSAGAPAIGSSAGPISISSVDSDDDSLGTPVVVSAPRRFSDRPPARDEGDLWEIPGTPSPHPRLPARLLSAARRDAVRDAAFGFLAAQSPSSSRRSHATGNKKSGVSSPGYPAASRNPRSRRARRMGLGDGYTMTVDPPFRTRGKASATPVTPRLTRARVVASAAPAIASSASSIPLSLHSSILESVPSPRSISGSPSAQLHREARRAERSTRRAIARNKKLLAHISLDPAEYESVYTPSPFMDQDPVGSIVDGSRGTPSRYGTDPPAGPLADAASLARSELASIQVQLAVYERISFYGFEVVVTDLESKRDQALSRLHAATAIDEGSEDDEVEDSAEEALVCCLPFGFPKTRKELTVQEAILEQAKQHGLDSILATIRQRRKMLEAEQAAVPALYKTTPKEDAAAIVDEEGEERLYPSSSDTLAQRALRRARNEANRDLRIAFSRALPSVPF